MINYLLRTLSHGFNYAKFYSGVAIKGANRRKYLRARMLLKYSKQDRAKLDKHQLDKLNTILTYANENVPYYHEMFRSIGLINNKKKTIQLSHLNDFKTIPFLDKEIIRKAGQSLYSETHQQRVSYKNTSGGSTGEKAIFLQDLFYNENTSSTFRFARRLMGIPFHASDSVLLWAAAQDIGEPVISQNVFNTIFKNTIILNSCRMTKQDMRALLHIINIKKPTFIRGYSQSLYELANFAKRENIKVYPQDFVISTATTLLKEMRELVESVFGCKVFDYYGSREVGAIASECFAHDGLHILEDNNILEVVDEFGNDIDPGGIGEIIVTTLNNYSMPLIRYRIGDRAVTYNKTAKCACGCNYKKLKQIVGRTADIFTLKNGDKVDGTYLTTLLNTIEAIERFQIIQHDYNLVELIVQAKHHLPDDEIRMIDAQLKKSMGSECIIQWRYTSFINPGPTGKYRYVISKIKNN